MPFQFHPSTENPSIVWYRFRGDGLDIATYSKNLQPPGEWDVINRYTRERYKIFMIEPFQICNGYSPDNLKWLETQYVNHIE